MGMEQLHTKREAARALLTELFTHAQRVAIATAVEEGRERGISRRTLTRACGDLGVREVHNGPYGAYWERG